jgi:dipeptidyl aminopeptidase/acylaminoacyl peptidase
MWISLLGWPARVALVIIGLINVALAQTVPIEAFFQLPAVARPSLSPDGKAVALLARARGRLNLVVYDLESKKAQPLTNFEDQDVVSVAWVNDKRIVFSAGNALDPSNISGGRSGGVYAIDRDNSGFRRLAQSYSEAQKSGVFVYRSMLYVGSVLDGSDDGYVITNERSAESFDVVRINTRTGRRTLLTTQTPARAHGWILDHAGVPRVVLSNDRTTITVHYRSDENAAWQKVHDADFRANGVIPIAVDFDGKTVYAYSNVGRDTSAVVQWDPVNNAPGRIIFEHPQVDAGELLFDRVAKKLVGVRFSYERVQTHWLDEGWRTVQATLDKSLPNAVNVFTPPSQGKRFLVFSYSDKNPGTVYLFDGEARKLEFLFDVRPEIKPEQMAEVRSVRYAARDGLQIPATLTVPKGGAKNAPTIILVHGGPWVLGDDWRWDAEAQFLASRGYAVLKPNFRGTIGFGMKHWVQSFKQWGGAMQDDLTDGLQWAIKQGIADPKRACIMGASYGGYAVMQGLVKTPEQYRCGVNLVGVTDLLLMQSITWSDASDSEFMKYRAPVMVGDPEADRAMLIAHSPARNADKIVAPVLMFYGSEDRRVPLEHGERMRDALKRAGKERNVLMEVLSEEGHGFVKLENRVKTYSMIEAFLKESLK